MVALLERGLAKPIIGSIYATVRIVRRDLARQTKHPRVLAAVSSGAWALCGVAIAALYIAMGAAT